MFGRKNPTLHSKPVAAFLAFLLLSTPSLHRAPSCLAPRKLHHPDTTAKPALPWTPSPAEDTPLLKPRTEQLCCKKPQGLSTSLSRSASSERVTTSLCLLALGEKGAVKPMHPPTPLLTLHPEVFPQTVVKTWLLHLNFRSG